MNYEGVTPPTYRNLASHIPEIAPVGLVQDINADISASIDLVRRIRMEIMRLDNDIRSSQASLGFRKQEDSRTKAELETLLIQWRSEKETLVREVTRLQELVAVAERSARATETTLEDLRQKGTELNKKISEKDAEIDVARKKKAKLADQLSEIQKKIESASEKSKMTVVLEEKADGYSKKQVVEAETSARLQRELQGLQKQHQSLLDESTELSVRFQQKRETSSETLTKKALPNPNEADNEQLMSGLWKDLALFEGLYSQMKSTIEDVRAVETAAGSTYHTVTTTTRTFTQG